MAELVYAFDLKSNGEIRAGSIPALGTTSVRHGSKKRDSYLSMRFLLWVLGMVLGLFLFFDLNHFFNYTITHSAEGDCGGNCDFFSWIYYYGPGFYLFAFVDETIDTF